MAEITTEDIAPAIRHLAVSVEELREHPRNPNTGDIESIGGSLDEFSQYSPIVYQASTGLIVKGNHTYKAAVARGWRFVAAVPLALSDAKALALLAGDNRHGEKGIRDRDQLAALLGELAALSQLDGTGYAEEDVDDLLRDVERDALSRSRQSRPLGALAIFDAPEAAQPAPSAAQQERASIPAQEPLPLPAPPREFPEARPSDPLPPRDEPYVYRPDPKQRAVVAEAINLAMGIELLSNEVDALEAIAQFYLDKHDGD